MYRSTSQERPRWPVTLAAALALAVVAGPPLLLLRHREARLAAVSTPEARAVWDEFREEMRRQSGEAGPVKHKVPKSVEPPELVWLRDYTPLAITVWLLLSSFLATAVVWFVWGASRGTGRRWGEETADDATSTAPAGDAGPAPISGRGSPGP